MRYLCFDPGLRHCAAIICDVSEDTNRESKVEIVWAKVFDLDGPVKPDQERALAMMCEVFDKGRPDQVLIEFQPPINGVRNPALIRWNSWVEGYIIGFWREPVTYIHSNGLKKYFGITSGAHSTNKQRAVKMAEEYCGLKLVDHLADCVLMAVYHWEKT